MSNRFEKAKQPTSKQPTRPEVNQSVTAHPGSVALRAQSQAATAQAGLTLAREAQKLDEFYSLAENHLVETIIGLEQRTHQNVMTRLGKYWESQDCQSGADLFASVMGQHQVPALKSAEVEGQ